MRALVALLVIGLTAVAVFQTVRFSRLSEQSRQLQQEIADLRASAAAPVETTAAAPADSLSDQERTELLRLRNQAAQLRTATNELQQARAQADRFRAENQELRSRPAAAAAVEARVAASSAPVHPRESWQFSGYATPEAALQSTLYAISKADYNTIMASLTPQEAQRLQREMDAGNKSPEEVAEKIRSEMAKATSYQVLESREVSPNQAVLLIYAGGEEKVQRVMLQKTGDEWKFAGSAGRRAQRE
jgi:Domain of unknown function (DUF4878)